MGFPSFSDSFRLKSSPYVSATSPSAPNQKSKSKPSHFRPTPQFAPPPPPDSSPSSLPGASPAHADTRAHGHGLRAQASQGSISKRDPFARLGHSLALTTATAASSWNAVTQRDRPDLPLPFVKVNGRPTSGSSFGTDYFVDPPPPRPDRPGRDHTDHLAQPASPPSLSIDAPTAPRETQTQTQRQHRDQLSLAFNSSLADISAAESDHPPVPPVPRHLQLQPSARTGAFANIANAGINGRGPSPYRYSTMGAGSRSGLGSAFDAPNSATFGSIPPADLLPPNNIIRTTTTSSTRITTPAPPFKTKTKTPRAGGASPYLAQSPSYDDENSDYVGSLPNAPFGFGTNRSTTSIATRMKADKMLGLETGDAKLCSLFLISGVGPNDVGKWTPADADATDRVQPLKDSLGFFWRPDVLGTAFSSSLTEQLERTMASGQKPPRDLVPRIMRPADGGTKNPPVPDLDADGADKMILKAVKHAHPRDVEVVNSNFAPNSSYHYFHFNLPSSSEKANLARKRLDSVQTMERQSITSFDATETTMRQQEDLKERSQVTFHGATLIVWVPSEAERTKQLLGVREQLQARGHLDSVLRAPVVPTLEDSLDIASAHAQGQGRKRRPTLPWLPYRSNANGSKTDVGDSDTDTVRSGYNSAAERARAYAYDSIPLHERFGSAAGQAARHLRLASGSARGYKGTTDSSEVAFGPLKGKEGDVFWMPYALTLVSRYPIYDTMIDYMRISWNLYNKAAKNNLYQMSKLLNRPVPRPGESYTLRIGHKSPSEDIVIDARFPGGVDFEKGLIKTDHQLWPLFQAIDIDTILTAVEIALSNHGKVVFTSEHTPILCLAVFALKYIVELRGWSGITNAILHSRDVHFLFEDPGPYIVGLGVQCRYIVPPPADACVIDLDNNTMTIRQPPIGVVTPKAKREKVKAKIYEALGRDFPLDRSIPVEFKMAYPQNRLRPFVRANGSGGMPNPSNKPLFLGDRLRAPAWWKHNEVMGVMDKIMQDKHKRPSLIQRLTKSGLAKQQAALTLGEQLAKQSLRRRAMNYVESRDNLEVRISKVNQRLIQLMNDSEKYKRSFEQFEKQADLLSREAQHLQKLIQKEKDESKRLHGLAKVQKANNVDLEKQLKQTEEARAVAMRQLSDMQENIHDLEREREAIINLFEDQITSAMAGMPRAETPSTPGTINTALSTSPVTRALPRLRPTTADSVTSQMSRGTTGTKQTDNVSILGYAKRGYPTPGKEAGMLAKGDKRQSGESGGIKFGEGREDVAARIASIQAKLDLALSTVGRGKPSSYMDSTADGVSQAETDGEGGAAADIETDTETETQHEKTRERQSSIREPARADSEEGGMLGLDVSAGSSPTDPTAKDNAATRSDTPASGGADMPRVRNVSSPPPPIPPKNERRQSIIIEHGAAIVMNGASRSDRMDRVSPPVDSDLDVAADPPSLATITRASSQRSGRASIVSTKDHAASLVGAADASDGALGAKMSASSLIRPGVSLRIRRKRPSDPESVESTITTTTTTALAAPAPGTGVPAVGEQAVDIVRAGARAASVEMTSSTSGLTIESDALISPSPSVGSAASKSGDAPGMWSRRSSGSDGLEAEEEGDAGGAGELVKMRNDNGERVSYYERERKDKEKEKEKRGNRMSTLSTRTITFGPIN